MVCRDVVSFLVGSLLLAACTPEELIRVTSTVDAGPQSVDPGFALDAGVSPDASPPLPVDAGSRPEDSGTRADAALSPDAGREPDAGFAPDAGADVAECYTEPFDPTVSVADLRGQWSRRNAFDTLLEAMRRRYPAGYDLLIEERNDPYTGSFVDRSSFGATLETSMTEVHEATHGWDYGNSLFYRHFDYWLTASLQHSLTFDVDGFPRSRIFSTLEDDSTRLYSTLYLTGDQGSRGFLELLDETNCYINGLGAIAAIADEVPYGISGRDGAVAFLYYVQRYLHLARTSDPALYARMQSDADLKEHIKVQWLRTHFFLLFADMHPHVGIRDTEIRARLYAPANISEISMLIGRCVDASNCLCD